MMGYKHEVSVWLIDEFDQGHWKEVYHGEHFATALFAMVFSKIKGFKCVRWEWR